VTGESGTGKDLVARLIHKRSRRSTRPWIPFNCAAVPAELIESILFGHRRGAFSGAVVAHEGILRQAHGGTLFLDEIGDLPLLLQAKLLRFLQDGEILPVGDTKPVHVDVRVVAATNRDLERDAMEGRFREDLFHRLNVLRLEVAPLRDRKDEVPGLAERLAASVAERLEIDDARVTSGAIGQLLEHDWPGNVRELANVLERSIALYGPVVTRESIEAALGPSTRKRPASQAQPASEARGPSTTLDDAMNAFERDFIESAVAATSGNLSRAAATLGVSLQRLRYRMRRLGMG
jgi:DNA-binding NtrC family response regulator